MIRGIRRAATVASIMLLGVACGSDDDFRFVRLSEPMPPLPTETLQGVPLEPADYRGKVVLLNFWASWCAPCEREQPDLEALWRDLQGRDVAFIGVNHRDRARPALAFLREHDVTYPSVPDPDGAVGTAFDVPFLPATVLVDPRGNMRYRMVGAQDPAFVLALIRTLDERREI